MRLHAPQDDNCRSSGETTVRRCSANARHAVDIPAETKRSENLLLRSFRQESRSFPSLDRQGSRIGSRVAEVVRYFAGVFALVLGLGIHNPMGAGRSAGDVHAVQPPLVMKR